MIIQTGKDTAVKITSSPSEMAQKIYRQTIEIEKLQQQNAELIEHSERLANWINWAKYATDFISLKSQSEDVLEQHKVLMKKYYK